MKQLVVLILLASVHGLACAANSAPLVAEPPGAPRTQQSASEGLLTPASPPAAVAQEAPPSPAPAPPTAEAPAVPKTEAVRDAQPAPVAPAPPALEPLWSHLLAQARITDFAIALFALLMALFAWRLTATMARLAEINQTQSATYRRTIEASEEAAEAARRSAEAAEKTVWVIHDTATRHTRPYVTVKEFLQGPVRDAQQHLHGWVFQIVWQNSGATPTRGFRYWAVLRQFEQHLPDDFDFAPPVSAEFAGGELGAHSTVTSGTLFISQPEATQLHAGGRKVLLYGQAVYSDIAQESASRETRFAVELVAVNEPNGTHAMPFTFKYHAAHNSMT
ncbi:MAG TPA: hypothetical protein VM164_01155 [Burkholderiales bacterium]|nr:hypothetical protein [Burkholderiales bacterium]